MKLLIAAVGRFPRGPEHALWADYQSRIDAQARTTRVGPLVIREIEDKSRKGKDAEAILLASATGSAGKTVVLDERGKSLTSQAFAQQLGAWRDQGAPEVAFLIGGADGHTDATRARADLLLSLSAMTLPHALARVFLTEQLYRAVTILSGHPYHRDG